MFGEPFGCLRDLSTHKYIKLLFNNLETFRYFYIKYYWPFLTRAVNAMASKSVMQGRVEYYKWITSSVQARIQRETQRPDFMTEILKHNVSFC